jgi:hypothetical protein
MVYFRKFLILDNQKSCWAQGKINPKVGEDNEWKDVQKKDTNKRPSETRNRRKTRKKIINKTSYFLSNSLNNISEPKMKTKDKPKK